MALETIKDKICMHQIVEKMQDEIITEGDMIVNDVKPDILKIISTSGTVCTYKKEVTDGKVRIDGTVNTYIIYLANDEFGSKRTLNTVLDFTYIIDSKKCKSGMTFNEDIKLNKIECKILNERKINIKAFLNLEGILYSDESIDIISNIESNEDIQILNTNKKINSLMGSGSTKVLAKDTMKVEEDNVAEIMRVDTEIINKTMKTSYNKVLAKADLELNIMYLTEDNKICNKSISIPIMGFIDMENINDDNKCDIKYKIKNIIIKPDSNNESSICIEVEIEIICLAYEQKEINLIEDMYSIYSNLTFNQRKVESLIEKENFIDTYNLNKQISISEIENLYNIKAIPEINNCIVKNSKIIYEMNLILEILFDSNNGMENKTIEVPFNFQFESELINENDDIKTNLIISKQNFNLLSGNIDIDINIDFEITLFNKQSLNIIEDVSMEDLREQNAYSMVIYFVKKGDTLWKIAKKFRSTTEDIVRVNQIEDVNKIHPGDQLYIPKYVRKNIA